MCTLGTRVQAQALASMQVVLIHAGLRERIYMCFLFFFFVVLRRENFVFGQASPAPMFPQRTALLIHALRISRARRGRKTGGGAACSCCVPALGLYPRTKAHKESVESKAHGCVGEEGRLIARVFLMWDVDVEGRGGGEGGTVPEGGVEAFCMRGRWFVYEGACETFGASVSCF